MMDISDLENAVQCAFDEDVKALTWLLMGIPPQAVRQQYAELFAYAWWAERARERLQ